jgi:hypothetical protein
MKDKGTIKQQAAEELKQLESKAGKLNPEQVLDFAQKHPKTALYQCFDWENDKAGHKWRIEQARELIRSVRITVTIEERVIRSVGYVHDPKMTGNQMGYINIMRVHNRSARDMMRSELDAITALCGRAIGIAGVRANSLPAGLADDIGRVVDMVNKIAARLEAK